MRLRRWVIAGTVTTLVASILTVALTGGGPEPVAPVAEAADQASAVVAAHRQGTRVEALDQRTPNRAVFANPDGGVTAELTPVPTRVRQGSTWVPIDTTLSARADGSTGPKAAVADVSFSEGGAEAPLVRLRRDGNTLALHWPTALPKPVLTGSSATYPEVLPGVDLVMFAEANGYRQHLLVKTPEAARNPALTSIRMGVRAGGVRLEVAENGVLRAIDAQGADVFVAPPSTMWDSRREIAMVGLSTSDDALTLSPDTKWLTDSARKFPVTIDPNLVTFDKNAWATMLSGKPGPFWWTSGEHPWSQVGQCFEQGWCDGIGEAWAYFQYDTAFLAGKDIKSAGLNTTTVYSPQCSERTHQLYRADGQINPGTTWGNKPEGWKIDDFAAPAVYDAGGCGGWKAVGVDLDKSVNTQGITTFYLKAQDSWDQFAWRKYDPGATKLTVEYNQKPFAPTEMNTDPRLPEPCRWCGGKSYLGSDNLRLIAKLSDPDEDLVEAQWDIWRSGVLEQRGFGNGTQISGAFQDTNLDLRGLRDGTEIEWYVRAGDLSVDGPTGHGPGPVIIDRTGFTDAQLPNVSAALYRQDNRWHGGSGVADTFTFNANGVADVDHYLYGWQDAPATKVDAQSLGGPASVLLTPPGDGPRELYVESVDRAGHHSKAQVYRFYVRPGNGALGQWSFEGNANDTAYLGDRHGTLSGDASYTSAGAAGSAVQLGGGAYVSAPNVVRTDTSFSVSSWVKLDQLPAATAMATAVSQDGGLLSGFRLGYRDDGWEFSTPSADSAQRPADEVVRANLPANLGSWTHLAASYDSQTKQIRLYVNGVLAGTQARAAGFNATGLLAIGRAKENGAPAGFWTGSIDETQVYDRVLTAAEISAQVGSSGVQTAHWKFDDGEGTTARNAVVGGVEGVLENGASFDPGGAVGGGLRLDGVDDSVTTAGPVVRTDQSFSVAAQVKLDRADNGTYTVVSQDGERICAFCLQYENGRWVFVLPGSDVDSPEAYYFVAGQTAPRAGEWTHLVGTYESSSRKIRLYIDGNLAGETTRGTAWQSHRLFRIGKSLIRGQQRAALPGMIDEVRMYNRAISEDEVRGIVSRDDVTAGTWRLDGTAADVNAKLNGVLNGGPEWAAGQTSSPDPGDLAVQLNGTSAHVSTANAIHTDRSFSVTAWARLDRAGTTATVLSQDGTKVSGFSLQAVSDRWAFVKAPSDGTAAGDQVLGGAVQVGVWTHLAGVYSKDRQRIELYVNGVLAGSAPHTTGFDATGGFQLGRGKRGGANADFFTGAIDDVSVYNRALFAGEVGTMAGRDVSLGHNWTLDEGSGTTSGDSVGPRQATLRNGASFADGRVGNSIRLDGVDDVVTTAGVDVRTDASFTVSAWVNLEGNTCDLSVQSKCFASAVSLDGGGDKPFSKFRLGHVKDDGGLTGNWTFEMPEADGTITKAAVAAEPGDLSRWVHLTGVYDAAARAIWLYVDGTRKDDGTLLNSWQGTGGLQIGQSKAAGDPAGEPVKSWRGRVDDVRMYSGALTHQRVSALVRSYPQPGGSAALPVADAGYWKFDESTGATAADSSGRGLTATLKGGATWNPGRAYNSSWLDGTTGFSETTGPVVSAKSSFSVAAWAYLTDGARDATVFGQDGTQLSTFRVQYQAATKKWAAVVPTSDQAGASTVQLTSAEPAPTNDWTHLTLVYDSRLSQLRLYVNGSLSSVQVGVSIPDVGGKFSIGRGKRNGVNAEFFPRGVDDVRAFGKALSDGEVRRVHDDPPPAPHGYWRFDDGTAKDSSWRQNPTTLSSGGTSFTTGVVGGAMQLDGAGGAARSTNPGVTMRDSFTVSAWAKLTRTDKVATVLAQDGARRSGFALQYRPEVNRWMFGAATSDTDSAPLVYAASPLPPSAGTWTHLAGVYDYAARQLRLYVNGQLAGTKDNVLLWLAGGGMTIGRGKDKGATTEYFTGLVDEVTTDHGVRSIESIRESAGYAAPAGGQLGRFVDDAGEYRTVNSATGAWSQFGGVPAGFRFDGPLGVTYASERPGTRQLYACGAFSSVDPGCEGRTRTGTLGWAHVEKPSDVDTMPLYRCAAGTTRFDSNSPVCDGRTQEPPALLGHVSAHLPLVRYYLERAGQHYATSLGAPPGYRFGRTMGLLAAAERPGTHALRSCVNGSEQTLSVDATCEGGGTPKPVGWIWTAAPPGLTSTQLQLCALAAGPTAGSRFASLDPGCEGQALVKPLGYLLSAPPGPASA